MSEMFEELRRSIMERRKQNIEKMREKYAGLKLSEDEAIELSEAEREGQACEGCTGGCNCRQASHYRTEIKLKTGQYKIIKKICPRWASYEYERRCHAAGLPRKYLEKSFDDYEITSENRRSVDIARWYIEENPRRSLYLFGGCGTGKTFLTILVLQGLIKKDIEEERVRGIIFGDVPYLMTRMKQAFGTADGSEVMRRYTECSLLIMDDLGAGYLTDWNIGILYEIINTRYNMNLPTIITSNLDLKGLTKKFAAKDEYNGRRITSRLQEMCVQGWFGEKDRRMSK